MKKGRIPQDEGMEWIKKLKKVTSKGQSMDLDYTEMI